MPDRARQTVQRAAGSIADAPSHTAAVMLAALPALLYTYMPRPPVPGAQFLVYPMLAGTLSVLLLVFNSRPRPLDPRLARVAFLLLLLDTVVVTSFLANAVELRGTAITEIMRAVLCGIFLFYGYCVARLGGEARVERGLLIAAYAILAGQVVLSITQIAGIPAFNLVYSAEKSRPFGSLLRATGSLANPNHFAWVVAQAGIFAFVLEKRKIRYLALFTAMLLVIAGGSRTLLVLFPCMVAYAAIKTGSTRYRMASYLILGGVIATVFVLIIYFLAEFLPYLAQLQLVLASGSLRSVNSFNARVLNWQEVFAVFSQGGWGVWLIGLGARPLTTVLDNDFFYVLFRFGIIGFLVHLGLLGYAWYTFLRARASGIAVIGLQYLWFALIFGLVADTLGGWNIPLLLYLFLGMTIGLYTGERRSPAPSEPNEVHARSAGRAAWPRGAGWLRPAAPGNNP